MLLFWIIVATIKLVIHSSTRSELLKILTFLTISPLSISILDQFTIVWNILADVRFTQNFRKKSASTMLFAVAFPPRCVIPSVGHTSILPNKKRQHGSTGTIWCLVGITTDVHRFLPESFQSLNFVRYNL